MSVSVWLLCLCLCSYFICVCVAVVSVYLSCWCLCGCCVCEAIVSDSVCVCVHESIRHFLSPGGDSPAHNPSPHCKQHTCPFKPPVPPHAHVWHENAGERFHSHSSHPHEPRSTPLEYEVMVLIHIQGLELSGSQSFLSGVPLT